MDERLVSMYRRFTWRILSNYVTPWEFERLKGQITGYEQWCARWSAHAARHVTRGDEALAAGHTVTAADAYLRGTLACHWASFVFTHDQGQFRAALADMAAALARAAPLQSPPVELLAVPFEGLSLPGYLRVPPGRARPLAGYRYPAGWVSIGLPGRSLGARWRVPRPAAGRPRFAPLSRPSCRGASRSTTPARGAASIRARCSPRSSSPIFSRCY